MTQKRINFRSPPVFTTGESAEDNERRFRASVERAFRQADSNFTNASDGGGGDDYVLKTGDTMTGPLTLPAKPTDDLHAATKNYVGVSQWDATVDYLADDLVGYDGTVYFAVQDHPAQPFSLTNWRPIASVVGRALNLSYRWTDTTSGQVPSGGYGINTVDATTATLVRISTVNRNGIPVSAYIEAITEGDALGFEEETGGAEFNFYSVTGPGVLVAGTPDYYEIPVAHVASDGLPEDDRNGIVSIIYSPAARLPVGGTTRQSLLKTSANDYDTDWYDLVETDITDLDKYTQAQVDAQQAIQDQNLVDHETDLSNPHQVTFDQTGAAPLVHTHVEDDITDLDKYTQSEVDQIVANYLPLAGGTVTGAITTTFGGGSALTLKSDETKRIDYRGADNKAKATLSVPTATDAFTVYTYNKDTGAYGGEYRFTTVGEGLASTTVLRREDGDARYLPLTGGTVTGTLTVDGSTTLNSGVIWSGNAQVRSDSSKYILFQDAAGTTEHGRIAVDAAVGTMFLQPYTGGVAGANFRFDGGGSLVSDSSVVRRGTGDARYFQIADGIPGDGEFLPLTGGRLTGDLRLRASTGTAAPDVIFQDSAGAEIGCVFADGGQLMLRTNSAKGEARLDWTDNTDLPNNRTLVRRAAGDARYYERTDFTLQANEFDKVGNRVLKMGPTYGPFGLGRAYIGYTDWNSAIDPGFYSLSNGAANQPVTGTNWACLVMQQSNTNNIVQIAISTSADTYPNFWVRTRSGGTWYSWREIMSPAQLEAVFLPLSGGILTGAIQSKVSPNGISQLIWSSADNSIAGARIVSDDYWSYRLTPYNSDGAANFGQSLAWSRAEQTWYIGNLYSEGARVATFNDLSGGGGGGMQAGVATTDSSGKISVTFATAFATPPVVVLTSDTNQTNVGRISSTYFMPDDGITATGFTATSRWTSATANGNNSGTLVYWTAMEATQ